MRKHKYSRFARGSSRIRVKLKVEISPEEGAVEEIKCV